MNPTLSPEQVEHEAKAKIFWGDEPEAVIRYLQINGYSFEDAEAFVDAALLERTANIRRTGFGKIVLGLVMLAVPCGAFFLFRSFIRSFMVLTILGLAGAVGLWGLCKVLKGIFMLVFPENEAGDVADKSE